MNNKAFIDAQNLHLGTTKSKPTWKVDLFRLRIYLREKYHVTEAYFFLGAINEELQDFYDNIQKAGYIIKFREHNQSMVGKKKGNVDTDIVFEIMKKLYRKEKFNKVVLVSGDGDYKKLVDFLIEEKKLEKLLFPSFKSRSSLYRKLEPKYYYFLDAPDVKRKIELQKNRHQKTGSS